MHLLRPLRHSVAIARPFIRPAGCTVAVRKPSAVRGLLTQSRDRGPLEVSFIDIYSEDPGFTDQQTAMSFETVKDLAPC